MLEQKPLEEIPEIVAFGSTSTMQAVNRVKNSLNYTLKNDYGISDPEITEKFLRLHGLNKEKFDYINALENLIEQGAGTHEAVDRKLVLRHDLIEFLCLRDRFGLGECCRADRHYERCDKSKFSEHGYS